MDISSSCNLDDDVIHFVPSGLEKSTSTTDLPSYDIGNDVFCTDVPDLDGSNVAVDAVHPLFTECFGTRRKRTVGTSTTEDRCQLYFCEECDMFVYKTLLDITNHFICRKHVPKNFCVYCGDAVFTYLDNKTRMYHHKCDNISPSNCDQLDRSNSHCDEKVNGAVLEVKNHSKCD